VPISLGFLAAMREPLRCAPTAVMLCFHRPKTMDAAYHGLKPTHKINIPYFEVVPSGIFHNCDKNLTHTMRF
jgi:hypothetical protein